MIVKLANGKMQDFLKYCSGGKMPEYLNNDILKIMYRFYIEKNMQATGNRCMITAAGVVLGLLEKMPDPAEATPELYLEVMYEIILRRAIWAARCLKYKAAGLEAIKYEYAGIWRQIAAAA